MWKIVVVIIIFIIVLLFFVILEKVLNTQIILLIMKDNNREEQRGKLSLQISFVIYSSLLIRISKSLFVTFDRRVFDIKK